MLQLMLSGDDINDNPLDVPLEPSHLDAELVSDSRHLCISLAALAECCGDGAEAIRAGGGGGILARGASTTPHGLCEGELQAVTLSASASSFMADQGQQVVVLTFQILHGGHGHPLTLRRPLCSCSEHAIGIELEAVTFRRHSLLCNRVHTPVMPAHQRPRRRCQHSGRCQRHDSPAHASLTDSFALASTGSGPSWGMAWPAGQR